MRFAWAERLLGVMATPDPCPPHEWEQVDSAVEYLLRCAKNPAHVWPDRVRGR